MAGNTTGVIKGLASASLLWDSGCIVVPALGTLGDLLRWHGGDPWCVGEPQVFWSGGFSEFW